MCEETHNHLLPKFTFCSKAIVLLTFTIDVFVPPGGKSIRPFIEQRALIVN